MKFIFLNPINHLYFCLKKENIKIIAFNDDGNEIINEILKKKRMFGEYSLNANPNCNENAKMLSDEVSLCSFLISNFEKNIDSKSYFGIKLNQVCRFEIDGI